MERLCSSSCAPSSGPRIAFAKNLRGQGSRLSTGQAEGCPHAPEEASPSPTVGFRVIIDGLVPIPEVTLSLVVGKEIQQAKKIPMNASGGGDREKVMREKVGFIENTARRHRWGG